MARHGYGADRNTRRITADRNILSSAVFVAQVLAHMWTSSCATSEIRFFERQSAALRLEVVHKEGRGHVIQPNLRVPNRSLSTGLSSRSNGSTHTLCVFSGVPTL